MDRSLPLPAPIEGLPFVDGHDTFMAMCRIGCATLSQMDEFIAHWVRWATPDSRSLHAYLGLSHDEYVAVARDSTALDAIFHAKNG